MSSDTQYEFADDFEQFFLTTGELLDKNAKKSLTQDDINELNELIHKMDHCCNQMDLEASLMGDEELGTIAVHKACRSSYNEIRKKIRKVEEIFYKVNKKNGNTKNNDFGYKKSNSELTSTGVQINDLDSTRQSLQGMDTLRSKYGMTNLFGGEKEGQITEQLITERDNRVFQRRVFYVSMIILLQMAVYYIVEKLFLKPTTPGQSYSE